MRILLLSHSFNSLTQRVHVELRAAGHDVSVELDIHDDITREAVRLFQPDVVVAPFLKRPIPEDIWRAVRCLIIHPGIPGDRGPSALDWAILEGETEWGVSIIEATEVMDGGPIWAHRAFAMRAASKGSLYRREVTEAATVALFDALERILGGTGPAIPHPTMVKMRGRERPSCRRADRAVDWSSDETATALRKIRSADGTPGAAVQLDGRDLLAFDAHPAELAGPPGALLARSGPAVAVGTRDGAVWIGHLKEIANKALKLPAVRVLGEAVGPLPEKPGYPGIAYEEADGIGYLHFPFYNGAMSTTDCQALREAVMVALDQPTRVLVLVGGPDGWSNGLHLGVIEAAASAADESLANIEAMDELCQTLIEATDRLVISAMRGNAGAGGVFLALAADEVWLSAGAVLNPHYKDMGNLYGSEYWTYLLPKRCGVDAVKRVMDSRLPMGAAEARELGLADRIIPADGAGAVIVIEKLARRLAADPALPERIQAKAARRIADEKTKPLRAYRAEELLRMRRNFFGFDPSYHVARYHFIHKVAKSRTPLHLAVHRSLKSGRLPLTEDV